MDDETPQQKGGKARAKLLSADERKQIAKRGAEARWEQTLKLPLATHGSIDRPLRIGDIEIPCYVLEDGRRVLVQTGVIGAMGMSHGGSYSTGGDRLAKFAAQGRLKSFVSNELITRTAEPVRFRTTRGGSAYGYEATVLADLCEAVLAARDAGILQKQQEHIVRQCDMLIRGFARVGIIALVDEATGYQKDRDRDELHRVLAKYLSEERLKWAKRFPDGFYGQLYRLRSWPWPTGAKHSPLVGLLTNRLVYDRLPPGVLNELKHRNPTVEGTGRRKWRHHQFLSEDIGQPDLRDHLLQLVAIMRTSRSWEDFEERFDMQFQPPGQQLALGLKPLEDA
jgi:hypothetical protein